MRIQKVSDGRNPVDAVAPLDKPQNYEALLTQGWQCTFKLEKHFVVLRDGQPAPMGYGMWLIKRPPCPIGDASKREQES